MNSSPDDLSFCSDNDNWLIEDIQSNLENFKDER